MIYDIYINKLKMRMRKKIARYVNSDRRKFLATIYADNRIRVMDDIPCYCTMSGEKIIISFRTVDNNNATIRLVDDPHVEYAIESAEEFYVDLYSCTKWSLYSSFATMKLPNPDLVRMQLINRALSMEYIINIFGEDTI